VAADSNPAQFAKAVGSKSSESTSSKQALIAELVGSTNFSTLHIFQMSRKFKAIAGAAKSVIAFEEFRQIMSDDMAELLGELEQGSATDSSSSRPDNATHELKAIGATIAASDTFLRRLFLAFDMDGDGKIDIREFVVGLNSFARGAPEEKVAALFEIYRSDSVPPGKGPPRVAISDLLGLFQGDRQLYQELMRCVDDYFVRVELRDETKISEDEFVSISLEEPHLLDNISRPLPSRRYASDDRVREVVRTYIEQTRLNWRRLLHIHRALVAWARQKCAVSSISLMSSSPQHSISSAAPINVLDDELQSIVLPVSDFHALLRGGDIDAANSNGQARPIPDDSLVQSLLLAYMASPRDGNNGSNATKGTLLS
jgi:Ca2+-binding EF-hand superfamily protein